MMHQAYVMLGSNIDPVENTRRALALLAEWVRLLAVSNCWETGSVGYDGPNFINVAVLAETALDREDLKTQVLASIEKQLGRVRSANKNAPRTIDLDIVVFDGQVVDQNLWERAHVAAPMAELLPDLRHPQSGQTLKEAATELQASAYAVPRPELQIT